MQLAPHSFKQLFPNDEQLHNNVERFNHLQKTDHKPRIAVFGKFNQGKSTLLNALVGQDIFVASDKRETQKNQDYYQTNLTHLYSWQEFIKINQRICKALQTMENSNYFS